MDPSPTPAGPPSIQVLTGVPPCPIGLYPASRFHGDGVRYKAKLIGIDHVTSSEGEKMCLDSMMKLKGFEEAFRKQGRHKQRVWLKVSSSGVRLLDERSGGEMYAHEKEGISAVTRDESDPRALAYVYKHMDNYYLFYLRAANLAEPVINDIREVCREKEEEPSQEASQGPPPPQSNGLLVIEEASSSPSEVPLENVFSPRSDTSTESEQVSASSGLMQVFSVSGSMNIPIEPSICPSAIAAPEPDLEPPKPALSNTQIMSMFFPQPGAVMYPPSPWLQQGAVGNQWAGAAGGPAAGPWPSVPGNAPARPPVTPPTGHMMNNAQTPHSATDHRP